MAGVRHIPNAPPAPALITEQRARTPNCCSEFHRKMDILKWLGGFSGSAQTAIATHHESVGGRRLVQLRTFCLQSHEEAVLCQIFVVCHFSVMFSTSRVPKIQHWFRSFNHATPRGRSIARYCSEVCVCVCVCVTGTRGQKVLFCNQFPGVRPGSAESDPG